MTTPVSHADVYTDFQGLSALRAGARDNSEESLREIAGQFEAIFIQMMLKSMRDANLGEGLMDSDHVKTYQSMFDQQLALDLSLPVSIQRAGMRLRKRRTGMTGDPIHPKRLSRRSGHTLSGQPTNWVRVRNCWSRRQPWRPVGASI